MNLSQILLLTLSSKNAGSKSLRYYKANCQVFLRLVAILFFLFSDSVSAVTLKTDSQFLPDLADVASIYSGRLDPSFNLNLTTFDELNSELQRSTIVLDKGRMGYGGGSIWALFDLHNQSNSDHLVVRYPYVSMQKIDFLVFNSSGHLISHLVSGKLVAPNLRATKTADYQFPLTVPAGNKVTLAIHFESTGSMQMPLEIATSNYVSFSTNLKNLLFGVYYGAILVLAIYSFFLFLKLGNLVYLAYLTYLISVALAQMSLHGIGYLYLWPAHSNWNLVSTLVLVGLMFASLSYFSNLVLNGHRNYLLRAAFYLSGISSISLSLLALVTYSSLVIKIAGFMTIFLPFFFIAIGAFALRRKAEFAPYYLAGLSFYMIGAITYGLKDMNIFPNNSFTENGIVIGSLLEIIIFAYGISNQVERIKEERDKTKLAFEKAQALSNVAVQVSHDIRSPVAALRAISGLQSGLSGNVSKLLDNAISRIQAIADDLLYQYRPSREAPDMEVTTPLATILESTKSMTEEYQLRLSSRTGVKVSFDTFLEDNNYLLPISELSFSRILGNLLENACNAIESSGNIDVTVSSDLKTFVLKVTDSGVGMSASEVSMATTKGWSKKGNEGFGLGLSFVNETVRKCGGDIKILSSLAIGTEFIVILPMISSNVNGVQRSHETLIR